MNFLAIEEPLEIMLEYGKAAVRLQKSISVTMRTPGQDFELALGFLFTENIIRGMAEVQNIQYCLNNATEESKENVVRVRLMPEVYVDIKQLERHFYINSSCGVCGKSSLENLQAIQCKVLPDHHTSSINPALVHRLPGLLRKQQEVFEDTGGLHAAALFDQKGQLVLVREDVGRHNALDKLIGAAMYKNMLPLHQYLLLLSGRTSFELIQKALRAEIPVVAAVGAPSSLAVQTARTFNMTLLGFVRQERFNIYAGEERIKNSPDNERSSGD